LSSFLPAPGAEESAIGAMPRTSWQSDRKVLVWEIRIGAMIGGFALAAAPAQYRVTGVQTFIVGSNGVVYQKDLGPDTLKAFQSMDRYNPDKTWKVTEDDVEEASQD